MFFSFVNFKVKRIGFQSQEINSNLTAGATLKVSDIDSQRMVIHVEQGKGGKDRYVPLPRRTLIELRNWYKTHRNPNWIFQAAGRPGKHDEFAGPSDRPR